MPGLVLGPQRHQILDDRLPRHRVDAEVMDDDDDATGAVSTGQQDDLHQPGLCGVQSRGGTGMRGDQVGIEAVGARSVFGYDRVDRCVGIEVIAREQFPDIIGTGEGARTASDGVPPEH